MTPLRRRVVVGVGIVGLALVGSLTALVLNLGLLNSTTSTTDKVGRLDGTNVRQLVSVVETTSSTTAPTTPAVPASTDRDGDDDD
jgi:hypothetical protein